MFKRQKLLIALIFLFVLGGFGSAQSVKISAVEDIDRDLKLVPCKGSVDRLAAVKALFVSQGAPEADINVDESKGTKNIVVTKKGSSAETIVIGAHYDKVDDGCGAIDNWTGIVAIAHLYGTLRNVKTTKTLKFIAFDKEEKGLLGSDNFVSGIAKTDRPNVCSMVNIDSLGFTAPWVLENSSNKKVTDFAKAFWKEQMKIDLVAVPISGADADSTSFVRAGIPAITFTGLNNDWQKYLHSKNDKLENVNADRVFLGYRVVLPFVMHLESQACDAFRKK